MSIIVKLTFFALNEHDKNYRLWSTSFTFTLVSLHRVPGCEFSRGAPAGQVVVVKPAFSDIAFLAIPSAGRTIGSESSKVFDRYTDIL